MIGVGYSGPTNSQHFTKCCKVAICANQQKCPRCGEDFYPFYKDMPEDERQRAAGGYYNHNTQLVRDSYARRYGYVY